jgi:hypothetical protein
MGAKVRALCMSRKQVSARHGDDDDEEEGESPIDDGGG